MQMMYSYNAIISIACPIVLEVGTLGNVLCFISLRGKSFGSSPTNFVLSTMLVVDQCVLSVILVDFWLLNVYEINLVRRWLISVFGVNANSMHSIACSVLPFLSSYFRHLSSFLVCLLTVERLIAVYVPLRCKQFCSARKIKIVCFSASLIYFLIDGHELTWGRLVPTY